MSHLNMEKKIMNYFSKRTVIDIYDWSGNTIHNAYVITYQCGKRVFEKKYDNHTLRHFHERKKIYDTEGFEYKIVKIPLTGERNEQNPFQGS